MPWAIIFDVDGQGEPVPVGPSSFENYAHGIETILLNTQVHVSETFLHSKVNLIIQYIIVQVQDGQNINIS